MKVALSAGVSSLEELMIWVSSYSCASLRIFISPWLRDGDALVWYTESDVVDREDVALFVGVCGAT